MTTQATDLSRRAFLRAAGGVLVTAARPARSGRVLAFGSEQSVGRRWRRLSSGAKVTLPTYVATAEPATRRPARHSRWPAGTRLPEVSGQPDHVGSSTAGQGGHRRGAHRLAQPRRRRRSTAMPRNSR